MFFTFWTGFYRNSSSEFTDLSSTSQFLTDYWPFIFFTFLLALEKLSLDWMNKRFNTTKEVIELYKRIEEQHKDALLKKKDIQHHKSDYSRLNTETTDQLNLPRIGSETTSQQPSQSRPTISDTTT